MKKLWLIVVVCFAIPALSFAAASSPATGSVSSDQALARLVAGNKRFVAAENTAAKPVSKRRVELAAGQHPFAVVIGCSDSRVPPEMVFDRNLGDLFVVRSAGNLVNDIEIGSVEYAVSKLNVHLVVILAHEKCGAIEAAISHDEAPGHIQDIVDEIRHNINGLGEHRGDYVKLVTERNALRVKAKLMEESSIISSKVLAGDLRIVTGYYHLEDGNVTFFETQSGLPEASPKVPAVSGENVDAKK